MSEPQQPPVPPSAQPNPAFPPAPPAPATPHLPATPQYPAAPQTQGQPPYGQPSNAPQPYGQQPYGQQPYGQQSDQQPRPASGSGNPLARTAFIVALIVAAVGALQIVLQPFVLAWLSYTASSFGVFTFLFAVIIFLGSAAAVVLGLIALRRSGGQVLAGIAIGVGGIQLIGIVLGWISSVLYRFF